MRLKLEIKEVNRNIPEYRENSNERFRVRYKDKYNFELLVVNICRSKTKEIQTFKFKSSELPDKDSKLELCHAGFSTDA